MNKQQFAEQVINDVRALPVSTVLNSRIELVNRYGCSKGLCPFHNDNHIGSFIVTDNKAVWKCFACGVGGDSSKFVSLLEGIEYLEAAFKIAYEFNLISLADYESYFQRKAFDNDFMTKVERKYSNLDKKKFENEIASDDVLDKVFRLFVKESGLSSKHKEHLKNTRHLSDKEIETGLYFTFPTTRKLSSFRLKLESEFPEMGAEVLQKIPGFFKKKEDGLWTLAVNKGIGIGIQNAKGQVVGIQIRHDEKKDEKASRYVWFSSSFASFDEKFEYGTSSGSPIDVVYPEEVTNQYVYVTEGRFKAQLLAKKMGAVVISVQGVGTWRGIVKELENIVTSPVLEEHLSPSLKGKPFVIKSVLVAFDADMNYKVQVFEQLARMTDALENVGNYKYPIYYLNWNEEFGKGIDDVFINNNQSKIKRYDKQKWDAHYNFMIKDILANEPFSDIKKVPATTVQSYFHEHFATFSPLGKGVMSSKHMAHLKKQMAS